MIKTSFPDRKTIGRSQGFESVLAADGSSANGHREKLRGYSR